MIAAKKTLRQGLSLGTLVSRYTMLWAIFTLVLETYAGTLHLVDVEAEIHHDVQHDICAAESLGYHEVVCPVWDPTKPFKKQSNLDWRVHHLYLHQNPARCEDKNFFNRDLSLGVGWGANMRGILIGSFWDAFLANRVFIDYPKDYFYASCETKSWSCLFEPLTNCTFQDHVAPLLNASNVEDPDFYHRLDDPKVRSVNMTGWHMGRFPSHNPFPLTVQVPDEIMYAGLYLYSLRLNAKTKSMVDAVLKEAIPCDFDARRAIALPIRGSDKCLDEHHSDIGKGYFKGESSCLGFSQYMQFAEALRDEDPSLDTIILTSEDRHYMTPELRQNYTGRWKFVTNLRDEEQGTGFGPLMLEGLEKGKTIEDVFMSFYSSLQLQMRAKYWILNCSSNFHAVLKILVQHGGCHFVHEPVIICLDEQMPQFKICSGSSAGGYEACMAEKEKARGQHNRKLNNNLRGKGGKARS